MSGLFSHWNSEKNCGTCPDKIRVECIEKKAKNKKVDYSKYVNVCFNPRSYEIIKETVIGQCVIAKIKFDNCVNFEGMKILVYDSKEKFDQLKRENFIDPHFSQVLYSPVARFEPTVRGEKLAIIVASEVNDQIEDEKRNVDEIQRIVAAYEKSTLIKK